MLNMYPKLASDSSSLILLVKSGTIQYVLKKNVIAIPKSVYEEAVVKGKLKGFEDSYIIEGYVQNSKIKNFPFISKLIRGWQGWEYRRKLLFRWLKKSKI